MLSNASCPRKIVPIFVLAAFFFTFVSTPAAVAQHTLSKELRDLIGRLEQAGGDVTKLADPADRARLFMHNDVLNAAGLNGDIRPDIYQKVQTDFDKWNTTFARDAARRSGARFTVQERTSSLFSPGTDSDYITMVKNKNQIRQMQQHYNDRVNRFLQRYGIINEPRSNWQNKLDTDFMADPRYVTSAEEFREIAKINNDAYKNRLAAEYERISRAKGGGRIGPEHVTAYADDMTSMYDKKRAKIEELLKDPSNFNDPVKRAKVFQTMAQEQKYISRLEALDDFVRRQEGLLPRNRGLTAAAAGSKRAWENSSTIREAHGVAVQSRNKAIQELAETLGEAALKNPKFRASAAADIAKLINGLPSSHQTAVLDALRVRYPGMVVHVEKALAGLPRAQGAGALDDAARAAGKLDDVARVGKMRSALNGAIGTLEALGKIAEAADVLLAVSQLKEQIEAIRKALDPATPDEEAEALLKKAREISKQIVENASLVVVLERHPALAAIYGAWTLQCVAGEWFSSDLDLGEEIAVARKTRTCSERHLNALERLVLWASGILQAEQAEKTAQCQEVKRWLATRRRQVRDHWNADDVCYRIDQGERFSDIILKKSTKPRPTANPSEPAVATRGRHDSFDRGSLSGGVGFMEEAGVVTDRKTVQRLMDALAIKGRSAQRDGLPATDGGKPATTPVATGPAVNPDLLNEANELGDAANAACKTADLRGRALRLREARFAAVPGVSDKAAELERLADAGETARTHFDRAKAAYERGDTELVLAELDKAQTSVDAMAGKIDCGSVAQSIAQSKDRANRFAAAKRRAEETLRRCEPVTLRTQSQTPDGEASHPVLGALKQRMQRQLAALDGYSAAEERDAGGDLNGARVQLNAIKASLADAPVEDCPALRQSIDTALDRIGSLARMAIGVDDLIRSCDIDGIKRFNEETSQSRHAAVTQMRSKLGSALAMCGATRSLAVLNRCRSQFGHAHAELGENGRDHACVCDSGHQWNSGQTQCVKRPTEQERIAAAQSRCQKEFGPQALLATRPDSNDRLQCTCNTGYVMRNGACERQLTVAEGHPVCRSEFGSLAYAAGVNRNGTFQCQCGSGYVMSNRTCVRQLTAADGHAACKRTYGVRSYATGLQANGRWNCYTPPLQTSHRTPLRHRQATASCPQGYVFDPKSRRCWSIAWIGRESGRAIARSGYAH